MASKISKKFCAVRFRSRSAAALATSAKREVPRANGRAAAGSAADFYGNGYFLGEYGFLCVSSAFENRVIYKIRYSGYYIRIDAYDRKQDYRFD